MPTEIVFSDGVRVRVTGTDARTLMQKLNHVQQGRSQTPTGPLPTGWADVQVGDEVIYVNPAQVAYVRDVSDTEVLEHTLGVAGV